MMEVEEHFALTCTGYDEDAALEAALARSRHESQRHAGHPTHHTSHNLQDDEDLARALQQSLDLDQQDSALASSTNVRPSQVVPCCGVQLSMSCKVYQCKQKAGFTLHLSFLP